MYYLLPFCLLPALCAETPTDAPFLKYEQTLTYYYKSPKPALGLEMLRAAISKDNLDHPFWSGKRETLLNLGMIAGRHCGRQAKNRAPV